MREILGQNLFKNLQPLAAQFRAGIHQPGNVPAGPSEAGSMSGHYQVSGYANNDGNGPSGLFQGADRRLSVRDDDIHPQINQFGGKLRKAIRFPFRPAVLDDDVLPLNVTEIAQTLSERLDPSRNIGRRVGS
jgi:hypothetical protein